MQDKKKKGKIFMTRKDIEYIKFEKTKKYNPYIIQTHEAIFDVSVVLKYAPEKWCDYFEATNKELNSKLKQEIKNSEFAEMSIHFTGDIMNDTIDDVYLLVDREICIDSIEIKLNEDDKKLLLYAFISAYIDLQ